MSTDEEAVIIVRMIKERRDLEQRGAAPHDEVQRIAKELQAFALELTTHSYIYGKDFLRLTSEQIDLLNASKVAELLGDIEKAGMRHREITETLNRAGLGDRFTA
jgi:hypothetical protein